MPDELAERLRKYTDEQLARAKADRADKEHELNLKLIADPVRWITFSTLLGSASTLVGAIAGVLLAWWAAK